MSEKSILFAKDFLKAVRSLVKSEGMNEERLPKWIRFARIRMCKINNSNIMVFEDSIENGDSIVFAGTVKSDIQFFLNVPEYEPINFFMPAPNVFKLVSLIGEYGEGKRVVFDIYADALVGVGTLYHSPVSVVNIFFNYKREEDVLATSFIPFALYVHNLDLKDFNACWQKCLPRLQEIIRTIYHSEEGDYYQKTTERKKIMSILKEKSVIVFGKDSDQQNLLYMCQVRDYLRAKNYDAYLLKELPEAPLMSNEEKAKSWALASRFCVMIDREPSGHIAEYAYLKDERVALAFLRQKGKGSTYMIGDDSIERNNVKLFEFENSPLQPLDKAIAWAEEFIGKKKAFLKDAYPWRRNQA